MGKRSLWWFDIIGKDCYNAAIPLESEEKCMKDQNCSSSSFFASLANRSLIFAIMSGVLSTRSAI